MGDTMTTTTASGTGRSSEPGLITSVDERLAFGMVDGLYTLALDQQDATIERTPVPPHGSRRAPAFRANVRWLQSRATQYGLLGKAHLIQQGDRLVRCAGDGTNKRAFYAQLYWVMHKPWGQDPAPYKQRADGPQPHLQMELVTYTARKGECFVQPLLLISRHALMRLYRRLGTTDHNIVRRELNHLATYYPHLCLLQSHAEPRSDQVWVLPSINGAFLVCRDQSGASRMVVKTWLSHRRLESTALARKLAQLGGGHADAILLKDHPVLPMVSLQALCAQSPPPAPADIPRLVHQTLAACYPPGTQMPMAFSIAPMPGASARFRGQAAAPAAPITQFLPGTLALCLPDALRRQPAQAASQGAGQA